MMSSPLLSNLQGEKLHTDVGGLLAATFVPRIIYDGNFKLQSF